MTLGSGLQITVRDVNTWNTILTAAGDLDEKALEIADALLQVSATGKNGVNTITTTERVKNKAQWGWRWCVIIREIDDGGYEQRVTA